MKAFLRMKPWIGTALVFSLVLGTAVPGLAENGDSAAGDPAPAAAQPGSQTNAQPSSSQSFVMPDLLDPYYSVVLDEWIGQGASANHNGKITIPVSQYSAMSENADISFGSYGGKNDVLVWEANNSNEWIEYEFDVQQGGLYNIHLSYHPFTQTRHRKPVALNVTLDGESHFLEAKSILLYRKWRDPMPPNTDRNGDDIRPMAEDVSDWSTVALRDSMGAYDDALQWYLTPGKHTLRFMGSDPVAIESIELSAPAVISDYKTVRESGPEASPVQAEPIIVEAEEADWKSDSAIPVAYDNDVFNTPYETGKIRYNSIDGNRWSSGNQELTWSFEVPEDGYYKIAMRVMQSFLSNRSTFRSIEINGQVPFEEMKAYRFNYSSSWQGAALTDEQGNPYEFYLKKGTNTISMRVTQAPTKPMIVDLEEAIAELKDLVAELKALTGGVDDPNRTWNIESDLPGFVDRLRALAGDISSIRVNLETVNGRSDAVTQGLVTVVKDIESLLKYVDEIPYNESRLVSMQGTLGDLMGQINSMPLQLDKIYIVPAGQNYPKMEANTLEKMRGAFVNFFYSFKPKERLGVNEPGVLNVWVKRGRDYVNLLQQMVEESFTPETGIKVRVNLLPGEELLVLMNAAGIEPDLALGVAEGTPFEYALRNGLYDLTQFEDFDEVFNQFAPGSMVSFFYNGGYYGLPETMTFSMLYYRKDILARLGLDVPQTWDELYKMLPILNQNNLGFAPGQTSVHNMFFLQNDADYIAPDGMKSAIGTEKGMEAFKQWTELYTRYGADIRVESFYQHFRDGTMPIGIGDFNMYIQLNVAAPELNGWWGVAPIPGTKQEDGTIARWMSGGLTASIMFKRTEMPEESWEFLKWWLSPEVQQRYGEDLETLNGLTFRWNTSNIDAFVELPWNEEDMAAFLEQWRWYKEIPQVPGSYFLSREIENAWNRTVIDGMNYRGSLEMAVKDIDREISRKMMEFGYVNKEGQVVRTLPIPQVNEPWDGVDKYVNQ